LHVSKCSSIKPFKLQDALNLVTTTSPSYPLMIAIESTVRFLESADGKKEISSLYNNLNNFKNSLHKNILVYCANNDITKLLIKFKNIDAVSASNILNNDYDIEEEYTTKSALLFVTGIGTTKQKLKRLLIALNKIADIVCDDNLQLCASLPRFIPKSKLTPRIAYHQNIREVPLNDSVGCVCAEIIMDYPPGIPYLLPGELITSDIINSFDKKNIKIIDSICE